MTLKRQNVSSVEEFVAATRNASIGEIVVSGDLTSVPTIKLRPGQQLTASHPQTTLHCAGGSDGVQLSANNKISDPKLVGDADKRIIFNDIKVSDFGLVELQNLTLTGVIQILATNAVRAGHVEAHNIEILVADARAFEVRPRAYGLEVIPGALTIWNQQPDPAIRIAKRTDDQQKSTKTN